MSGINFSLDIGQAAESLFDISGSQARQQAAIDQQERWNRADRRFDREKFGWAQYQQRKSWTREDSRFQRMLADANKAGISLSTALGAGGATPTTVGIPGHSGTRVMGNQRGPSMRGAMAAEFAFANAMTKKMQHDSALEQQFQADLAYWNSKQAEQDYAKSSQNSPLPKKYLLYDNNLDEAQRHIRSGGFVIPNGASMELPESIGAYQFGVPYFKEENFLNKAITNPGKYKIEAFQP